MATIMTCVRCFPILLLFAVANCYGGQSWNLSSFNLLQQDQSASTFNSSSTDASLSSGGFSENYSWGGVQLYNVSGTFIKTTSITTVIQNNSHSGYTVSEQGTFTNAAFTLSGYAFAYAQSSQQTTSATGGSTETMARRTKGSAYFYLSAPLDIQGIFRILFCGNKDIQSST